MLPTIIDEPNHKRWLLPDMKHCYNTFIYGDFLHITVLERVSGKTVLKVPPICLSNDQWQNLADMALALAERKYRRVTKGQQSGLDYMRSYRR